MSGNLLARHLDGAAEELRDVIAETDDRRPVIAIAVAIPAPAVVAAWRAIVARRA
jgi:hypothetical protein